MNSLSRRNLLGGTVLLGVATAITRKTADQSKDPAHPDLLSTFAIRQGVAL